MCRRSVCLKIFKSQKHNSGLICCDVPSMIKQCGALLITRWHIRYRTSFQVTYCLCILSVIIQHFYTEDVKHQWRLMFWRLMLCRQTETNKIKSFGPTVSWCEECFRGRWLFVDAPHFSHLWPALFPFFSCIWFHGRTSGSSVELQGGSSLAIAACMLSPVETRPWKPTCGGRLVWYQAESSSCYSFHL